jgi:hypothetical protein
MRGNHTDDIDDMDVDSPEDRQRLKKVAVRVIVVQIITLVGLWLLQSTFS